MSAINFDNARLVFVGGQILGFFNLEANAKPCQLAVPYCAMCALMFYYISRTFSLAIEPEEVARPQAARNLFLMCATAMRPTVTSKEFEGAPSLSIREHVNLDVKKTGRSVDIWLRKKADF
ncbi:hypothetical protein Y032_0213g2276 [Ancylostoma ceylanicum]|uniref:Uncharacterized protein n=1 Tax=Ancylostoma ceylanicum TaxID=53326 RepID=A0A016SKD4_9BILA|nr:hypothetical protein Y032_0213g2276 [Ancylostoma ceylanicum]